MKKIRIVLVLTFIMLFAMGCGSNENKVLKVGTESSLPLLMFRDTDNNIAGMDADLAEIIANELDMELEIVDMSWDGVVPSLESGRVDLIMGGLEATPERAEKIGFSEVYLEIPIAWAVREDSEISSPEDLDGKVIVGQVGSTLAERAEELAAENGATVKTLGKYPDVIQEVITGRADMAVLLLTTYLEYAEQYPDLKVAFQSEGDTNDKVIGIGKDDDELKTSIDNLLSEMEEDGRLQELREKWLGDGDY